MDYGTQLSQWNEAIKATNDNINLGSQLKDAGMAILNSLEIDRATQRLTKDFDTKELAELVKNATLAIREGAKLESESRKERARLVNSKPLEL